MKFTPGLVRHDAGACTAQNSEFLIFFNDLPINSYTRAIFTLIIHQKQVKEKTLCIVFCSSDHDVNIRRSGLDPKHKKHEKEPITEFEYAEASRFGQEALWCKA
jgi:hypothetical protein